MPVSPGSTARRKTRENRERVHSACCRRWRLPCLFADERYRIENCLVDRRRILIDRRLPEWHSHSRRSPRVRNNLEEVST